MTLRIERFWPGALAALVAILSILLAAGKEPRIAQDLANPVLTMVSICIGFLAAAVTILLTAPVPAIKQLAKSKEHFQAYVGYHWSAMLWGFLSAVLSLTMILVAPPSVSDKADLGFRTIFCLWAFATTLALAALLRVVYLLRQLLNTLPDA